MSSSWPIRTVVLDLDDTLYPERDYVLSGFHAAGKWIKRERKVPDFANRCVTRFESGRRGRIFDEVLAEIGLEPDPVLVRRLIEVYREHSPRLTIHTDADEFLEWANGRFNLGLLTDGYAAVQARKIRALGLETRISCRIITDELGREFWKPSVVPYRRIMTHFGGESSDFIYVGDNPRKDFIGARALGWRTVRIRRPGGEYAAYEPPDTEAAEMEITTLRDLKSLCHPLGIKS